MITWTYLVLMVIAIASCSILLPGFQRRLELPSRDRWLLGCAAFVGAMLGAKLPFVIAEPMRWFTWAGWLSNGKTIMFGIVGGYFAVELAKRILGIRVRTGDSFAFPVALAVSIGRLACFSAGCCFGRPTDLPWGIRFSLSDDPEIFRHPTQIYESLFHGLAAAVLLLALHRLYGPRTQRNWFDVIFHGNLLKAYICSYMLFRFATEFLRPEPTWWCGLSIYQFAAAVIFPVFAGLWASDVVQRIGLNRTIRHRHQQINSVETIGN